MSRTSEELLVDALEHFEILGNYARRDLEDQLVIDAICMRLSAGIEVLAQLESDIRDQIFASAWPLMWGMRNRIAHGYLLVDTDIVRQTVQHDVPGMVKRIKDWLKRHRR